LFFVPQAAKKSVMKNIKPSCFMIV